MKLFNLVLETPSIGVPDTDVVVLNFLTDIQTTADAEAAARAAVTEFLGTDIGAVCVRANSGEFNWGDAANDVPAQIWKNHDLFPLSCETLDSAVCHDEDLTDTV